MKFTPEFLIDSLYSPDTVLDEIVSHGRWTVGHRRIFRHEGKLYQTLYWVGATETQDESPYQYARGLVECPEVQAVEKLVTVYEVVPGEER